MNLNNKIAALSLLIEERFKRELYEMYDSEMKFVIPKDVYSIMLENVKVVSQNKSTKSRQHYYLISEYY